MSGNAPMGSSNAPIEEPGKEPLVLGRLRCHIQEKCANVLEKFNFDNLSSKFKEAIKYQKNPINITGRLILNNMEELSKDEIVYISQTRATIIHLDGLISAVGLKLSNGVKDVWLGNIVSSVGLNLPEEIEDAGLNGLSSTTEAVDLKTRYPKCRFYFSGQIEKAA